MSFNNFAWLCEVENASASISSSWSISQDCAKFSHGHEKSIFIFPFKLQPNSFLVHFARLCEFSACSCEMEKHSFSTPFCHFCHFFLLNPPQPPWNISKTSQKPLVSLVRVAMYYLSILGIITTQKVWNSWELLYKICTFWVVINDGERKKEQSMENVVTTKEKCGQDNSKREKTKRWPKSVEPRYL